jgi:hypothetical protein
MALAFKNANLLLTTSATQAYQVPANTSAIITMLQAANKTSLADKVTVQWVNNANSAVTSLVQDTPVPARGSVGCITGKMVLKAGDIIRAQCATHQSIEVTLGILEIS